MASIQRAKRRTISLLNSPSRYAPAMLVNERHLVNFPQRSRTLTNLCQTALAEGQHTLLDRCALNFRSGPAVHDHLADPVGQVQQLANRGTAMIPRPGALQASGALGKLVIAGRGGRDAGFQEVLFGHTFRT